LIGRGGSNIRDLRDRTNTRVVFPAVNDADQELITIIGKKENVDTAVKELKARVDSLVSNSACWAARYGSTRWSYVLLLMLLLFTVATDSVGFI